MSDNTVTIDKVDGLGVQERGSRWRDRNGNTWHWNQIEAVWRKTLSPQSLVTVETDPDPSWFGPWTSLTTTRRCPRDVGVERR
ncbi:hypothetical protein F0Q45_10380 [Mycobacterium simiae]|uniref:DUF7183 domain-containing protein n=1 Tax=Mycobacterium simiae TaxID=1784 RepID=A0A5B1BRE1_MYCSI|nr:hypothetical protein [Mycobacterium simiae]KAA1250335.1 hypothetical protein F0Q45_10380 [Mycobacterium simiae]